MAYPYLQDLVRAATGASLPLPLPTFGLCVLAAVLLSIQVAKANLRRLHASGALPMAIRRATQDGRRTDVSVPPQELALDFGVTVVLAGIIGARVFSIAETPREFFADPLPLIFTREGFNFLGGLLFGIGAGILFVRRHRIPLPVACDAFAPSLMLGYALGRVGCQLAGDGDWGIAANVALKPSWLPMSLWAQTYDGNIVGQVIPPPGVYPTPLYEIVMGLGAFALLWALRKHPFRRGWLFALYLLLCGLERLAIETIRVNPRVHVSGLDLTQAQILSALLVVVGLAGLAVLSRRRENPAR
ncbi:MAG TPA: prolipoprotein diacylglyceryl transferase [Steroidobacteraceae bacterium]|jgi:phosphatidylglycerol:prolipoprotein diacylglycerol transferase